VPDSFSAVNNATTRDIESEIKVSQEGKVREIVMDNVNSRLKVEGKADRIITTLKSEKEEVEASLNKEKIQTLQLKEELAEIDTRNTELYKELQSVRNQLAAEQSRCFKLEVEVAELRQKLQTMETLQKELELLQRQRAVASEQAATMNAKRQSSGGVWGWLAGTPPPKT
jgi:chromosome segregation ATPase